MINELAFRQLESSERQAVDIALMTLAQTGILLIQKEQNERRILNGFADNSNREAMLREILYTQHQSKALQGLHDLGAQLLKEKS